MNMSKKDVPDKKLEKDNEIGRLMKKLHEKR